LTSKIDYSKTVHIIVHGQIQLLDQVEQKLISKGFKRVRMKMASLDKAGQPGDYVAMVWPPMDPKEIIVCEIVGQTADLK
jgi:hypothetical protein